MKKEKKICPALMELISLLAELAFDRLRTSSTDW
jgi:hypothetical protein